MRNRTAGELEGEAARTAADRDSEPELSPPRFDSSIGNPGLLDLQRLAGNQAVGRLVRRAGESLAETAGRPQGSQEKEADSAADRVVQEIDSSTESGRRGAPVRSALTQRAGTGAGSTARDLGLSDDLRVHRGAGHPLPPGILGPFQQAFQSDLSSVRVYDGAGSAAMNRRIGSRAFATGSDVHFAQGAYSPDTTSGRHLLAHELAHTIQSPGAETGVIHPKLEGSSEALTAAGGTPSRTAALKRSSYSRVLSLLKDYENQERKVLASGRILPALRQKMATMLQKLDAAIGEFLQKHEPVNPEEAKKIVAQASQVSDEADPTKIEEAEDPKTRRGHALIMLRARVAEEVRELRRPDYLQRRTWTDKGRTGGKDDAFGGGVNRLDLVEHGAEKGVFIQDRAWDVAGTAGKDLGIPNVDASSGARSVAMTRLAELFETDVLAKTEFAVHTSKTDRKDKPLGSPKTKFGVRQELAFGGQAKEAAQTPTALTATERKSPDEISLDDPVLQRQLNILQFIDAIAGQLDRHWHNYFIATKGGKVTGIVGIDLDMAFAVDHKGLEATPVDLKGYPVTKSNFVGLPALADADFRQKILAVSSDQIRTTLKGLITDAELGSTVKRFELLRTALTKIDPAKVVKEWNAETAEAQMDEKTSYLGKMRAGIILHTVSDPASKAFEALAAEQGWGTNTFQEVEYLVVNKVIVPAVDARTVTAAGGMAVVDELIAKLRTDQTWLGKLDAAKDAKARAEKELPEKKQLSAELNKKSTDLDKKVSSAEKDPSMQGTPALEQLKAQDADLKAQRVALTDVLNRLQSPPEVVASLDWLRKELPTLAKEGIARQKSGSGSSTPQPGSTPPPPSPTTTTPKPSPPTPSVAISRPSPMELAMGRDRRGGRFNAIRPAALKRMEMEGLWDPDSPLPLARRGAVEPVPTQSPTTSSAPEEDLSSVPVSRHAGRFNAIRPAALKRMEMEGLWDPDSPLPLARRRALPEPESKDEDLEGVQ